MNGWTRRLAYIEQPPTGQSTLSGVASGPWTHLAYEDGSPEAPRKFPVWVRDVMPSRDERITQGLVVGSLRTQVRMRWRDDITSAMRITLLGGTPRVMQIIGGPADIGGPQRMLEVMCEVTTT